MASKNLPILDWIQIEASAPGKFIISGEYSVVYDKQAVAAAIDLRTRVVIRPNKDGKVRLNLKNLNNTREWPTSSLTTYRLVPKFSCLEFNDSMPAKLNHLLHSKYQGSQDGNTSTSSTDGTHNTSKEVDKKADDAAMAFLLLYIGWGDSYCNSARPPIDVEVESDVPVGSGLGSSSAYSVSLCGALVKVFRVAAEKHIISNWAFNIDKFFHGRPSGVDNNVSALGGCILFQKGRVLGQQESRHKQPIRVLLVDTCVSRSTRALSEGVVAQLRENTTKINGLFASINEITTQIWRKVSSTDFAPSTIADLLQANQAFLDQLGVGHEKLNRIIEMARGYNLAAKQTGAGGGGTAFILYDESDTSKIISQLKAELESEGFTVRDHSINYEGLCVKVTHDPER